jgi:hypothetical protein
MTSVSLLMVMIHRHHAHNKQTCTVLLAGGWEGLVVAKRPGLRDRVAARWRPRRLDRALASGTPPEASAALALRAERLTEADRRHTIAKALRRVLRDVQAGERVAPGRVPLSYARVKAARDELSLLADTLEAPGPVTAGGVAQAWMLLTDGTGPLYNPYSRINLCAGAARATRELRPWPA